MIEFAEDPFANRPEILRDQNGLVVLWKVMQSEKAFLARCDPPVHKQIPQPHEKNNVHDVLDRERIAEMTLRRMIENEHGGATRENKRKKSDDHHASADKKQDRLR